MRRWHSWVAKAALPLSLSAALGCSSTPATTSVTTPPNRAAAPSDAGAPPLDAGPPLDEVTARAILFDAFANRGYRLRFDVPLKLAVNLTVTIDGYDPDRGVGYEYIAFEEIERDVTAAARAAWPSKASTVLLIGPADRAALDRAIQIFFERIDLPAGRGFSD